MAIEIPFDGIDVENVTGFDTVAPGLCLLRIVALDEDGGKKGDMIVDLEVLRHQVSNQVSKVHRETFYKNISSEACRKKFMAFAFATELTTPEEVKALAAEGKSPSIEYSHAIGKLVVMKLQDNEYDGRHSSRMEWSCVWHPAAKGANDCPLDMAAINAAGIKLPEGRNPDGAVAAGKSAGGKASSTPTASKQAANVADVLSGI